MDLIPFLLTVASAGLVGGVLAWWLKPASEQIFAESEQIDRMRRIVGELYVENLTLRQRDRGLFSHQN